VRAIDTNVLVRYLTGDHPDQSRKARALIDGGDIFVSITVFLESEWVLRSAYRLSPSAVRAALRAFAGLPGVTVENPTLLADALDRTDAGMDFADALHLGAAAHCDSLLTFDGKFVQTAPKCGQPVEEIL
jgi:predicted nucleic acid-binding protein